MNLRKLLFQLIFLIIIALGFGAYKGWKWIEPQLSELKEKDPDKYAEMIKEAKGFHIREARGLFEELDKMTYEEVLTLRYNKWKSRRKKDKKFRLAEWESELEKRESTDQERSQVHEAELNRLLEVEKRATGELGYVEWEKADPWQKALVLRNKCNKYVEMEKRDSIRRRNALDLPRTSVLLDKPRYRSLSVSELCALLVPVTYDEKVIQRIVENLKKEMNYYYFARLVEELGIPRDQAMPYPSRLKKMTRDFSDS